MNMPGFTAEISLSRTTQHPALRRIHSRRGNGVEPQALRCIIDQDGTAASGHVVFSCVLDQDGVEIYPPRKVLM